MAKAISADTRRRIARHVANLGNEDSDVAAGAERRLFRFGVKAVEQVIPAASSPNPEVRFRAVWVLGKSKDPEALSVIWSLTDDPDESVRYDATLALGEMGDLRSVPLLEQIAQRTEDPGYVASAALMALAKLGVLPDEEEDDEVS